MDIEFVELNEENIMEASGLVRLVYSKYVSSENTDQGNELIANFMKPESMGKRLSADGFGFVAKCGNKICGMIEVRDLNHICLLFVDEENQRKGIAKTLVQGAREKCRRYGVNEISVNSSLYAVAVYEKLGFKKVGEKQTVHGIQFVPMKYTIKRIKW